MSITINLFGHLVDIIGAGNLVLDNISDTDTLTHYLHQRYPALATTKYIIAVDKKIAKENTPLNNSMVLALLPPFSGG